MNNIFIPNPSSTLLDIQDAIDDKQQKIETLLELLLIAKSSDCKPEYKLIYEILYMITDFYDEIHNLEDFKKDWFLHLMMGYKKKNYFQWIHWCVNELNLTTCFILEKNDLLSISSIRI